MISIKYHKNKVLEKNELCGFNAESPICGIAYCDTLLRNSRYIIIFIFIFGGKLFRYIISHDQEIFHFFPLLNI